MIKLYHDSQNLNYRSPFGACELSTSLTLSLDAPADCNCTLRLWYEEDGARHVAMQYDGSKFTATIETCDYATLMWYYFIVQQGDMRFYLGAPNDNLGGVGEVSTAEPNSWQITVFEKKSSPEWYKNSVVYQIFPDRFARGADYLDCRNASDRDETRRGKRRLWHEDWNDNPFYCKNPKGEVTRWDFFGGTLLGICEKIPYLKTLGVGAIYLNPIFLASSNHRYDTGDYMKIDPALGDLQAFETLCSTANENGIRIILDGVFSHTGADSIYFDYFSNYGTGAYSNPESKYRDWFCFNEYPHSYDSWWGVGDLPNTHEMCPSFVEYICTNADSVAKYWLRHGASGWRLDVADELPDEFIEIFKTAILEEKPDALLLGEVWEDASNKRSYGKRRKYFSGRELDATMHYPLRSAVLDYLGGVSDAFGLARVLMSIAENYPPEAHYSALNLIGSHDRARAITVLGGAPMNLGECEAEYYELSDIQYNLGCRRLMLSAVLQFCCVGVPCIYYGDEVGVTGMADPHNRRTYPWGREDLKLLEFYRKLTKVYTENEVLKSGGAEYFALDCDVFCCRRYDGDVSILTAVNTSQTAKTLEFSGTDLFTNQHCENTILEGLSYVMIAE